RSSATLNDLGHFKQMARLGGGIGQRRAGRLPGGDGVAHGIVAQGGFGRIVHQMGGGGHVGGGQLVEQRDVVENARQIALERRDFLRGELQRGQSGDGFHVYGHGRNSILRHSGPSTWRSTASNSFSTLAIRARAAASAGASRSAPPATPRQRARGASSGPAASVQASGAASAESPQPAAVRARMSRIACMGFPYVSSRVSRVAGVN